MEVGAVKQAFNNEIILMKRNLNQAKIQIIHKLTRKAKTLAEKKAPEKLKEKLKKKAESAIKEVFIIKKIKAKDIAKFIITHEGELKNYLNKPEVDLNKACARLLLHKSLQEKHKNIRDRFGNSSIEDLFMSRLERRKIKKEARENQKNKKKGKEAQKKGNAEDNWVVEDIENNTNPDVHTVSDYGDDEIIARESESSDDEDDNSHNDDDKNAESDYEKMKSNIQCNDITEDNDKRSDSGVVSSNEKIIVTNEDNFSKSVTSNVKPVKLQQDAMKKRKEPNKNKNFNEKILKRNFKKDIDEKPTEKVKIVDPFFITTTGDSYMSVAEPRQPDEVKDVHRQGNRKYRRAVMFGHVPTPKPRRDDFKQENRKFKDLSNANNHFNNNSSHKDGNKFKVTLENEKVEKLHPSWEAKKRKSAILPFQGKKIVFDDGE